MKSLWDIHYSNPLGNVNIENILSNKGYEYEVRESHSGRWAWMKCPLPGHDDNNPSFSIHLEHGGYNCYVCGSGNWQQFCSLTGIEIENDETIQVDLLANSQWKEVKNKIIRLSSENITQAIPHPIPKDFKKLSLTDNKCSRYYEYLDKRDIHHLVDIFQFGYSLETDPIYKNVYKNRLLIPCHSITGKYQWLEGRLINNNIKRAKYWRPKGVSKINYLFNMHRVIRAGYDWVIVVEGIIDAMMLWAGGYPAVCCFGSDIHDNQIVELVRFNKIYICLDNDKAGIEGYVKVRDKLKGIGVNVYRILLPPRKDVNVIGLDHFHRLYKKAIYIK
jgi:DNA primase